MKRPCEACGRTVIVCPHCEEKLDDDGYSHSCPKCKECSNVVAQGTVYCAEHLKNLNING